MCRGLISRAVRVLAAGLLFIAMAAAQDEPRISNVFIDTDLRQALVDVAAQAGVNIIADPSVGGLVSAELEDATVDEALELLLAGTGYQVLRTDEYYLVYTVDVASDMFTSVAETEIVRVRHVPADVARSMLPDPLQRYVRVDPATNILAITAPPAFLERIRQDIALIDVPVGDDTVYLQLEHVPAATAQTVLPQTLQRYVRVDEHLNRLAVTAPQVERDLIRNHVAQIDVARAPSAFDLPAVNRTHVVKLNHTSAEAALAMLPPTLQSHVRADIESGSLAISVPPSMLPGVLADIRAIDVPRQHVMLDARVVVLERVDLLDFGGEWKWPTLTAGTVVGDAVKWPWELRIGYTPDRQFTQALSLTLHLLTANQEGTVIASPQVMAQDGREAEIRVTTEEWFQITADVGTFLRADLQEIETGTILLITPRIGPDGDLTLDMNIEVSDVVARGQEGLPVVSRRTARSTFQIESGGTAAVAGLVDTRSQAGTEGVPGISNIPLLGHAFRTDTLTHRARQVAVFVTATIVDQQGYEFQTGRERPPVAGAEIDEALFRLELESVLDGLYVGKP